MKSILYYIKRFFKSHIFRTVLLAVAIFCTAFFPIVFYPQADENFGIVVALTVFACILEVILYLVVVRIAVQGKIEKALDHLNGMTRGNVPRRFPENFSIDNVTSDVIQAVNATANEYIRLEQVRRSFVSNASHELRSPLTSVQGFLQAVLDGTANKEDSDKYLKIALSETKRLNALISSMLDLSRLDSGKNPIICTKFDINDIINDCIVKFEPSYMKKSLQVNTDFVKENCYVYADKDKIVQVMTNLVDNAIKYSPSYARIEIKTMLQGNKVHVSIKDQGCGIGKKEQMLIWDRFYMTDKSRSPVKTKGSGLGLSIVKKIIEEHGETVWVESNRGSGAEFIFTLTVFDPLKHKPNHGQVIKSAEK